MPRELNTGNTRHVSLLQYLLHNHNTFIYLPHHILMLDWRVLMLNCLYFDVELINLLFFAQEAPYDVTSKYWMLIGQENRKGHG